MEFLAAKFEETDMSEDAEESQYKDYARKTMTNWGPDNNLLEYEEARGGVESRGGLLRLRIYGDRGDADPAAHPELFYGYMDPGDWDPRGTADGPDMKRAVDQWNARMRFQRWDNDGCEFETSGRRNEWKEMEDNQTVFKWVRDRLKIFTTQKDGRREGMRRTWQHKPDVTKCVMVRGYGDYIADQGLTPQRRSVRISDKIIRDSVWFRSHCNDQRRDVMRYGQQRRGRRDARDVSALAREARPDGEFSRSELTKCYRAVGLLLSELVRGKAMRQDSAVGDADYGVSDASVARKHAAIVRDLTVIMQSITTDNQWGDGETTRMMKTASPKRIEHMARLIVHNHLLPANTYLNAMLMSKSVKPSADHNAIRKEMITDSNAPEVRDVQTIFGKMSRAGMAPGASVQGREDTDRNEHLRTHNYRAAARAVDRRVQNFAADGDMAEHTRTQTRKRPGEVGDRIVRKENLEMTSKFRDNQYKDRRAAPLGGKYLVRDMSRDHRDESIAGVGSSA